MTHGVLGQGFKVRRPSPKASEKAPTSLDASVSRHILLMRRKGEFDSLFEKSLLTLRAAQLDLRPTSVDHTIVDTRPIIWLPKPLPFSQTTQRVAGVTGEHCTSVQECTARPAPTAAFRHQKGV